MSSNDITGDALRSRAQNRAYDEGYERIFGGKKKSVQTELEEKKDYKKKTPACKTQAGAIE
jgi:hypothetical protein